MTKNEKGSISIVSVIGVSLSALLLILLVDLGGALFEALHERNALSYTKDALSQPEFQLRLKNEKQWSVFLANRISESVQDFGFSQSNYTSNRPNELKIVMYEIPNHLLKSNYRCLVWGIEYCHYHRMLFTGLSIPVIRNSCGTITFYASSEVWGRKENLQRYRGIASLVDGQTLTTSFCPQASIDELCEEGAINPDSNLNQKMKDLSNALIARYHP